MPECGRTATQIHHLIGRDCSKAVIHLIIESSSYHTQPGIKVWLTRLSGIPLAAPACSWGGIPSQSLTAGGGCCYMALHGAHGGASVRVALSVRMPVVHWSAIKQTQALAQSESRQFKQGKRERTRPESRRKQDSVTVGWGRVGQLSTKGKKGAWYVYIL